LSAPGDAAAVRWPAPVLVGTLLGSLVAGRLESGLACVGLAALAAAAAGAQAPSLPWWRPLAIGFAIAIGLNLVLTPGTSWGWRLPFGLVATREGLAAGALLSLRVLGAAVSVHGLRAAWPGERAADEIARVLRPLERVKVPVREAHAMVGLALRFVPLLGDEARRIARIQDLRAGSPPRGPVAWLERRRAAAVPMLVSTLERAERVGLALEARHYRLRPIPDGEGWGAGAWVGLAIAGGALLWRS
jgi:energy-coupling factor transport system permease protein